MSIPKNIISLAEFDKMQKEFNTTIKNKLGKQETQSVWFSFDELKNYFAYIEKEAVMKGITVSGIRFHMVAQTSNKNQLTLALVPTYMKNNIQVDFDPVHSTDRTPVSMEELAIDRTKVGENGGILNKGLIYP